MRGRSQVWRTNKTGLSLLARVTPGSAHDSIEGMIDTAEGPALKVRVRAVAEGGKANRSVETAVAEWLGIAKARVVVARGGKSRLKTLDIGGEPGRLEFLIAARLAALQ